MIVDSPIAESLQSERSNGSNVPLWLAMVLAAAAGGLGWGIRGQYGHETGAMIPGLLVALVLVFLFCPRTSSLRAARVVAMTAVAFSFGGAMTYGQTVGLTHDVELRGNWPALGWGMLGLFVKGGIWIGLGGAFLGMGLSARRYRPLEIMCLLFSMTGLLFVGLYLVNEPFNPSEKTLPNFYFSDHWDWEPDKTDLRPRREQWGGLLFALLGLMAYLSWIKKDLLARNMAFWGIVAGGCGFTLGQSVQAFHAWNAESFGSRPFAGIDRYMNWWNMMEIFFGFVLGGGLALGMRLNRRLIAANDSKADSDHGGDVEISPAIEWTLLFVHAGALAAWSFMSFSRFDTIADQSLTMGLIPLIAVFAGRYWPYLLSFPLLALPIAGKTLRQLSYRSDTVPTVEGWIWLFLVPMAVMVAAALCFLRLQRRGQTARSFARWGLLCCAWFYFAINFAFFDLPWPWAPPTFRTPSGIVMFIFTAILTVAALTWGWREPATAIPALEAEEGSASVEDP